MTLSPKKMMDPGVEPFTAKTLGVVTDGALHVASMEWSAAPFCPLPDTTTCTLKKSGAPGVNVVGFVVVDENVAGGGLPFCDQRKVYDEGANRAACRGDGIDTLSVCELPNEARAVRGQ